MRLLSSVLTRHWLASGAVSVRATGDQLPMWSPEFNGERDAVTDHCAGNCSMGHRAELCANLTVQHVLTIQQLACVLRPKPGAAARFFT